MLDPLGALGLASAIVQFVDFSSSILKTGYETYHNFEGATQDNLDLEQLTGTLYKFQSKLTASNHAGGQQTDDEVSLQELVTRCRDLARQLLQLLGDLKTKGHGLIRTWDSFRQACRSVGSKKKIARLEALLDNVGLQILQINSCLIFMIRCV